VHYGDASRIDLLHAAGCEKARLFVLAIDDVDKSLDVAHTVKKHFPQLPILARVRNRQHYYQMAALTPHVMVRETMGSALEMAECTLRALGRRAHEAHRLTRSFQRHDERAISSLARLWGTDQKQFFAAAREALQETERLLREESGRKYGSDHAWDTDTLRRDVGSRG